MPVLVPVFREQYLPERGRRSRLQAGAFSGGQGAAACPSRLGSGRAAQRARGRPARRKSLPSDLRNRPFRAAQRPAQPEPVLTGGCCRRERSQKSYVDSESEICR